MHLRAPGVTGMTTTKPTGSPNTRTGSPHAPEPAEWGPTPWERFADVLLQREAALCRIVAGVPPRDFAGLFIGHDEIDALLRTLPGLDGPPPQAADAVRAAFAPAVAAARAGITRWLDDGEDALARCARAARLPMDEAEVLALLCAVEIHPQRQRLVAYVQDSVQHPRLTLATLFRLLGPEHLADRAVSPASRAARAELIALDETGPWAARMAAIPARLVWALRGDASPDPDLPAAARRVPATAADGTDIPAPTLLLVHGADGDSRLRAAADHLGGRSLLVTASPTTPAAWRAVVREATIGERPIVLDLVGPPTAEALDRIERADHLSWVLSSPKELPLDALPRRAWTEIEVADGTASTADWRVAFGARPPSAPLLDRTQLRLTAAAAGGDPQRLPEALRRLAGGHLDQLAVRVRPRRAWADLVLPADQTRQLRELAARQRWRDVVHGRWGFPAVPSRGVVALFAGPSGTGKTLAAEVVAAELALDLYKVDLSAVVSKWIGETEKNLERIFTAAAAGELVLFFDEADALFGKRSEVSDARDRYANIEVAYLLQRLESYDGLVVMATNLQRNIDPAFLRRISVAIDFGLPEEDQRRAIWAGAFPAEAPTRDLDLDFLARQFKVPGGVIANAARTAAFLAADGAGVITMDHVALGMKREFQKLGRMRTEAEFADYYAVITRDS